MGTPTIQEYILYAQKTPMIEALVADGATQYGMQTFDQSVLGLLRDGLISEEEALRNSNHPNELLLKLKGIQGTSDRVWRPLDAVQEAAAKTVPGPPSLVKQGPWVDPVAPMPERGDGDRKRRAA